MLGVLSAVLSVEHRQWLVRRRRRVRWGNLRRLEPFSSRFGFDRGTPIDRHYMEQFLTAETAAVHGIVGEICEAQYARAFGGSKVQRIEVIDRDPDNPRATLTADLSDPQALPIAAFDCLIVTQTLQYLAAPAVALGGLGRALRPGGTLLLAVPALTAHDNREPLTSDFWRFWPAGLSAVIARSLPSATATVTGYGNLLTAVAFLQGLSTQDLSPRELGHVDARFPVVVCARVDMPAAPSNAGTLPARSQ